MSDSMRIKIVKKFSSPLTGKKANIDDEMNVPRNQFWIKRIAAKDCIEIKKKAKAKKQVQSSEAKADVKNKSKGSK